MINYSIIIPHFNIPELLEKLLVSIPCDMPDVEVIVVDDRSDHRTETLLHVKKRFEEKGVRFFRNRNGNKGAGRCRNIGMRQALGKWLIFADSDDYFLEDFYETVSKYADSDADLICFKADSINIVTGKTSHRHLIYNDTIDRYLENASRENELQLRLGAINPWCKMINREFALKNHLDFDETLVANDVRFSTEAGLYANKVIAVDKAIYMVTERQGSLTRSFDRDIYMTRNRIFAKRCALIKRHLKRAEWKSLNITGHNRLIAMLEEGYPYTDVVNSAMYFLVRGVSPVDLKQINHRTMFNTAKELIKSRN